MPSGFFKCLASCGHPLSGSPLFLCLSYFPLFSSVSLYLALSLFLLLQESEWIFLGAEPTISDIEYIEGMADQKIKPNLTLATGIFFFNTFSWKVAGELSYEREIQSMKNGRWNITMNNDPFIPSKKNLIRCYRQNKPHIFTSRILVVRKKFSVNRFVSRIKVKYCSYFPLVSIFRRSI